MSLKLNQRLIYILILVAQTACAHLLLQGSFITQVPHSVIGMLGYNTDYVDQDNQFSNYGISAGYLFNIRNTLVIPVMLESNLSIVERYLSSDGGHLAPKDFQPKDLELMLKPGFRLDDHDYYFMVGYQLLDVNQDIQAKNHMLGINIKPNFYGLGYASSLSEYLDYLVEVKLYYQSDRPYALDMESLSLDRNLKISDATLHLGLRVQI